MTSEAPTGSNEDEWGNPFCQMQRRAEKAEAENQRLLEAIKYIDRINSYNKPLKPGESVPSWYMYAEERIEVIE